MTLLGDCKLCLKRQKRSDYETGAIRLNFRRITLSCSRAFRKMKRTAISFITSHVVQRIRINHLRCQETTYKQQQFIRSNIDHHPEVNEMIKKVFTGKLLFLKDVWVMMYLHIVIVIRGRNRSCNTRKCHAWC